MHRLLFAFVLAWSASTASAQADTSADSEARLEYERGRVEFEAGHFDEAARLLRHAYVLSPRFGLLYNIGQAELRAGRDALALEAFEGFLRQAPTDEPTRSEVEERVRVLRGLAAATPMAEAPVAETPAPAPREPEIAPWILAGVGGAVLIAGGVLLGVANLEASRVTNAARDTRWSSIEGAQRNANTFSGVGITMLSVGAAATAVGLVWGAIDITSASDQPSARLHFLPTGVLLEGSF